jgi:phospholipid transport system substrate-binding protein
MPLNNPNRRAVLAGLSATVLMPLPAFALTTSAAQSYVQNVINVFFNILRSGGSEARILRRFEREFVNYTDINIIARSVLGPAYRGLSNRQKQDFNTAYGGYVARKYGRQMLGYAQAEITITQVRDAGNKGILVSSQVRKPGQSPFALDWQVSDRSGQTKLINLIVEGLSLLTSEREEVRNMLAARGGDVSALTAYLAAQ